MTLLPLGFVRLLAGFGAPSPGRTFVGDHSFFDHE
jgi:hypothetical protein